MKKLVRRTRVAVQRQIKAEWPQILKESGIGWVPILPLVSSIEILGTSLKVTKGEAEKVLTAVVYASPSTESGRNTCSFSTKTCAAACLGHNSGRLIYDEALNSRLWKTALFFGSPSLYRELLEIEIAALEAKASRLGFVPAVRLDGSTDLGLAGKIAKQFPNVQFYDYTKVPQRMRNYVSGRYPKNWTLTLSYSGENAALCHEILLKGGTVAVVIDTNPKNHVTPPATFGGFPTVNGDLTDIRFGDPKGHVVVLSFKGIRNRRALLQRAIESGFVTPMAEAESFRFVSKRERVA